MKYDGTNLREVLDAHIRWLDELDGLKDEEDKADLIGADLKKADLREVDLRKADLRAADLRGANLIHADLRGVNLRAADLRGADLRWALLVEADLRGADLEEADLRWANLMHADLRGVNLRAADLRGADLRWALLVEADLIGADLKKAYLREVDLRKADLRAADLRGANLMHADLRGVTNAPFIPMACPDTGAFIAWKKCLTKFGDVIVKLLIPEDAKRTSSTGRKCRADKAVVLEIQNMYGEPVDGIKVWSIHDKRFTYAVGKTVTPEEPFCEDRFEECASGIHFFVNRQEAVEY